MQDQLVVGPRGYELMDNEVTVAEAGIENEDAIHYVAVDVEMEGSRR
jgi:hypothetical protein